MFTGQFASFVAVAGIVACFAQTAYALGGNLKTPGISIPLDRPDGGENNVAVRINQVLVDHQTQFVNGSFINSYTSLNFKGNSEKLNSLLKELAEIEGSKISILFSKEKGIGRIAFPAEGLQDEACQWTISHNGRSDAELITLTIFLGDGLIELDQLKLPTIRGAKLDEKLPEFTTNPKVPQ